MVWAAMFSSLLSSNSLEWTSSGDGLCDFGHGMRDWKAVRKVSALRVRESSSRASCASESVN